ncbi:MAG: hypothetical protein RSC66_08835, partial [Comamonas sp.]
VFRLARESEMYKLLGAAVALSLASAAWADEAGDKLDNPKPLADDVTLCDTARTAAKLLALDSALDTLNCTAAEKETVMTLANQALFGLIMANTERTDGLPPLCPTSDGQITEYRISREDGVIRLRALCTQDVDHVQDEDLRDEKKEAVHAAPHMHKSLEMRIDIAIQADGQAQTPKLDVLANKG